MMKILLVLGVVGLILGISELLLTRKVIQGEIARKFVHIIAGSFMASWAFFLDVRQIQILSVVLLAGVLVSKLFKLFAAVHGVRRKTWGEAFFAISIGLTATLAPSKWVFAAAILHMSLADGLAAVIGTKFGKSTSYIVFNQYKTLIGTATFFVTSVVITSWLVMFSNAGIDPRAVLVILWLPLIATIMENLAAQGIDNIAVPMVVVGAFHLLNQIYI